MSALPILASHKAQRVGLFTLARDRELGLDRREPGLFYPTGYASIMIVANVRTRGARVLRQWSRHPGKPGVPKLRGLG